MADAAPETSGASSGQARPSAAAAPRAPPGPGAATSPAPAPGYTGGAFRPLSTREIERILATALDVLERIGIGEPIPEILDVALPRGCTLDDRGRLLFPRGLVEDVVEHACRSYVRYGVDPALDQEIAGERVYFATSGEAVTILDYATQTFRPSTPGRPLRHCAARRPPGQRPRLRAALHRDRAQRASCSCTISTSRTRALAGTRKPFALSTATVDHVDAR